MSKLSNEIKWGLCAGRCERIYERSPDKGFSFGPREVLFDLDNAYWARTGAWLFSFGGCGTTYVVAFGTLEDALENAAALLPKGYFVEPDYDAAASDCGQPLGAEPSEAAIEAAEADLTYTESGWLASWEWHVDIVTPEQVLAFVRNGQ